MDYVKVSAQALPESQVLLEIVVDPEQMEKSLDRAYKKLVQRVNVPGFRKGKTPRNMLERHLGPGRLLEEAIDIVIPEAYNQAIEDQDIDAIGQPKIEVTTTEPLAFKATIPVRPTVDLGDYRSLRIEREPVEVDEKDVESSVEELQRRYALHEPVERPVQVGDIIRADIRIEVDGKEVYKDDDTELHLHEGRTVLLPGFTEGVAGAVKGEPKDVTVTLPDDAESSLAGKTAIVHVVVKEVKEERLPEQNDDFAQGVGEGFPSLEALKERLRNDLRERLEAQAEDKYRDEALRALVDGAKRIEFPPVLVEREVNRFLNDQARSSGLELDRYLELLKKTPEQLQEELTPSATERVKRSLTLSQLSDQETIEVTESDIDDEIEKLVSQASGGDPDQVERYRRIFQSAEARSSLERSLLTRKTMDRLVEITSGEAAAPAATKKTEPKKADAAPEQEPEPARVSESPPLADVVTESQA
ncbi:MAG TPA: trigger factor [Dehalococcoidia bacterium]|jgi:trigger factor|nr:trigger factor [Dehalococcoidia bacterium]